ncbi:MAG: hypothetical protein AB1601_10510 [Planctomycetota bacterium]
MKKASLSVAVLLTLAVGTAAWGQGEAPPYAYAVSYEIARFTGARSNVFLGLLNEWATPVPFDPDTDVAYELDRIWVQMVVVDADLAGSTSELKFYYRVRAWGAFGPPAAPPLNGTTDKYVQDLNWEPLPPPPDNAVYMDFWLRLPEISGPSQLRLRGLRDWDVYWLVEVRLSNEETPEEEAGAWTGFSFFLYGRTNPLLAPPNPPPFADAGPDQIVAAGRTAILDGSQSFDSSNVGFNPDFPAVFEKDILEYAWEWISGPERVDPEANDDGNDATAQVTLSLTGDYVYRLLVEDGVNPLPSTDEVTISVVSSLPANRGPRAIITAPTTPVALGTTVRLSAERSSDPDGDKLSYRWRQTNAVGGALEGDEVIDGFQPLVGVTEKIASWKPVKTGTYYFSLLVTDPGGLSDTAFTSVQVIELATAGKLLYRPDNGGDEQISPVQERTAPGACGTGSLFALTIVPVMLWFARGRRR